VVKRGEISEIGFISGRLMEWHFACGEMDFRSFTNGIKREVRAGCKGFAMDATRR
jgi:hypothetical protein